MGKVAHGSSSCCISCFFKGKNILLGVFLCFSLSLPFLQPPLGHFDLRIVEREDGSRWGGGFGALPPSLPPSFYFLF